MPYFTNRGIMPLPAAGGGTSPISTAVAFWYDASDAATFTLSGSNVTQWRDKSGNARHLTKQSGTLDAALTASVKNSLSGVYFGISGATGSVLETTSAFTLSQPNTVVMAIVGDPLSFTSPTNATIWMVVSTADQAMLLNSSIPSLYATGSVVAFGGTAANNTAYTWYGQFNGSTSRGGVNGVDVGSDINPGTGFINAQNIQIGRTGTNLQFVGYMLEIFAFAGVSGTNLSDSLTYLVGKWGHSEMSVDFVGTFSAPTDGVSSCASAIALWRAYIAVNPGDTLTIPAHVYNMEFAQLITSDVGGHIGTFPDTLQIPTCTIIGTGGTPVIKSWYACGSFVQFVQNQPAGYINTCYAGDPAVTLTNIAYVSNFAVNGWICVCGIALQFGGAPPNFQRYEFHQITNITGAVLTLDSLLRDSYASTWPNNIDGPPSIGGAACLYYMGPGHGNSGCWWDHSYTIENLEFKTSDASGNSIMNSSGVITTPPSIVGFSFQPVRTLTCTDIIFGGAAPGVSFCETMTFTRCTLGAVAPEVDKCSTTAIYDDCTITGHLNIQSASPENLIIRNGTTITDGFNSGFPKNTTIANSTVSNLFNSGAGYGRCETLTVTNSTMPTIKMSVHGIVPTLLACLTYQGSGRFLFQSSNSDRVGEFEQAVIPGFQYAFSYMAGDADINPDPQFTTSPIYFCITDISDATGSGTFNYYVQTDMTYPASGVNGMGSFPTPTYNTNPWNGFQAIPFTEYTIDGVHQGGYSATQSCPCLTDSRTAPPAVLMPAGCM